MSEAMKTTSAAERSLAGTVIDLARHYVGGERGLIVLAVAVLGAAAVLNWGWLAALGIGPQKRD